MNHAYSDCLKVLLLRFHNDGKSGMWGGTKSKGAVNECDIDWKMFLHSDLLRLYLNQKYDITELLPDTIVFF